MSKPNVLVIAGHDPSGGAGIQADIESTAANGAHAACVITLLTCQDTTNVHAVQAVDSAFFARCLDTAVADMRFAAIKLGVIANTEQVETIAALVARMPDVPLVVDPVLVAAGGGTLADDRVGQALRQALFGRATVITPNAREARALCDGEPDLERCGALLSAQAVCVLITGGDENDAQVVNRAYAGGQATRRYEWPRLDGVFHGSGCTLASAIAAQLARGQSVDQALARAQQYTWHTLEQAFVAGRGQRIPARVTSTT